MVPQIQPDFTEAVGTLPPGEYAVRIVKADVKTAKTSGDPYINWELETFGKDDESLNGRKIWHSTPVKGKGAGILQAFLKALGISTEDLRNFDTDEQMGKELVVVVVEDKENPAYPRVKSVKAYGQTQAA